MAACLADNGRRLEDGPVIGVALDGTGYGDDGAIWGGEWLAGDYRGFRRMAHLEYLPLPGGDAAVRSPWRIAVAYLHALLGTERFPSEMVDETFDPQATRIVRQQIERGINTPVTSSMGRLFDAVSALLSVCHETTYEAQAAIELEQIAAHADRDAIEPYPFGVEEDDAGLVIRLQALFEALLDELARGTGVPLVSLRFHATVARMVVHVCEQIQATTGLTTVALSGGVFQNRLLLELTVPRLEEAGFELLLHRQVPCNDGGVSLGQAVLAQFLT